MSKRLGIVGATGATVSPDGSEATAGPVTLAAPEDATPAIAPGVSPAGYLDLDLFGVAPTSIGDEQNINFNVPAYQPRGQDLHPHRGRLNGTLRRRQRQRDDITFEPQTLPDPPPNGVLRRTGPT